MGPDSRAGSQSDYDALWSKGLDYARYNPGGRHRRRLILSTLARLNFATLLDIGCGGGYLLQTIGEAFGSRVALSGADLSPLVIEEDKRRLTGITFFPLDIQNAAPPRTHDVVICSEVIEHLVDRGRALRNLADGVSPGGHLLLTFPLGTVYPTDRFFGHTTHPTLKEIRELSKQANLEVAHQHVWGWPFFDLYRRAINIAPDWTFHNFAEKRYGWSQKAAAELVYLLSLVNVGQNRRGSQALMLFQKPSTRA